MNTNIAVIDLETTGVVAGKHEIVEIGVIYCELVDKRLEKIDSFHSYVKPYRFSQIEPSAMQVNQISDETLDSAPMATEVRSNFENWWQSVVATKVVHAGHNPGFDKGFLSLFLGKEVYDSMFEYWTLDSKSLAWAQQVAGHIPEDESLSLLPMMEYFDIYNKPHSALGDSWASLELINKLIDNQ